VRVHACAWVQMLRPKKKILHATERVLNNVLANCALDSFFFKT
jgi:hypothetical protein